MNANHGSNPPLANIGPYELTERVGSGGMGSVYRARDTRDGRVVALKLMHEHVANDPSYAERFKREAAMAALIDSPNVVRVLEFASDGRRPFIVTEFVDGPGIDSLLKSGPVDAHQAAAIAIGVANALDEASRRGIVHRDIKPGNILIGADGVPKVTDFGIATLNHAGSLTIPGIFIGTAAYAAPEQHRGEADTRSDIYSLGVVLFEMLTGSLPFQAETATGMMRQHEDARVPLERLAGQPQVLSDVVARCLAKSPSQRYQDPRELVHALLQSPPAVAAVALPAPVVASELTVVGTPEAFDASATRIEGYGPATGEFLMKQPALAAAAGAAMARPMVRKALVAAAVVAVVTLTGIVTLRGSSADEPPASGGGRGISGPIVESRTTLEPAPSTTPPPSSTPAPRKTPIIPETVTAVPSATIPVAPTKTPPPPPAPPTQPPAAPLALIDWVFCHQAYCPYGDSDLYSGYPIAVGFELSSPTSLTVSVEVWFDGTYYYTSNFTPSANGQYYDVLPFTYHGGELELDIYVGGQYLDTLWADVYGSN